MNTKGRGIFIALSIFFSIALAACGGGSETEAPAETSKDSNWDKLKWNQDNWQ